MTPKRISMRATEIASRMETMAAASASPIQRAAVSHWFMVSPPTQRSVGLISPDGFRDSSGAGSTRVEPITLTVQRDYTTTGSALKPLRRCRPVHVLHNMDVLQRDEPLSDHLVQD